MKMQAVLIRAAIVLAMGLCLSVVMFDRAPRTQQMPVHAPAVAAAAEIASTTPIVVLPTVTVRPSALELAAAMRGDRTDQIDDEQISNTGETQRTGLYDAVSFSGLRLDMPYYSFGKVLPHVSKE
jgi:hypothetical protein